MRIGIAGPVSLRMLRPLFAPQTEIPDTWEFPLIADLAERFHSRGHDIVVFALSSSVSKTKLLVGDRIQAYICPLRRGRQQMLDFWRGERRVLADAMRASKCEVIHAHWAYEFGAAALDSGIPHVITAHDNPFAVLRFARHPYWIEKPLLACSVLKKAKCVTAVSPYVADSLGNFLRPRQDILVVCNGVDGAVFELYKKRRDHESSRRLVFASVLSNFGVLKNSKTLIRAFNLLRDQFGDQVELWMFGEGHEEYGVAAAWASKRSLHSGICFKGYIPSSDLLPLLARNVDVFVHPSLEEACSMAVIEAMAMGLPVIGGKSSGGVPWLLSQGKAGMLVDVTSPASIAMAMGELADGISLRTNLAAAGRQLASVRYRIDSAVDSYENILLSTCADRTK